MIRKKFKTCEMTRGMILKVPFINGIKVVLYSNHSEVKQS